MYTSSLRITSIFHKPIFKKDFIPFALAIAINFGISIQINAQEPDWNMTPQSPDVATFGTYGTYPISYYTGSPNITIPLFTIDEGEVQVPIDLSYSAGGVKVATESSWVGLGWNLYPGGSITRMVVGSEYDLHDSQKYDSLLLSWDSDKKQDYVKKYRPGQFWGWFVGEDIYDFDFGSSDLLINVTANNMAFWSYWSLEAPYFQPDIYIFNFLGYSGKFFLNPKTNKIVILDKKDHILFEKDNTNWDPYSDGWIARLPNGIVVHFNDLEKVTQSLTAQDCPTQSPSLTWKITKIILRSGEEIDFSYVNSTYETASISDFEIYGYVDDEDHNFNTYNSQKDYDLPIPYFPIYCTTYGYPVPIKYELKTLSQISSPKYLVYFNLVQGVAKPRLASIEIVEKFDTSFKLGYDFSLSPFTCIDTAWNAYKPYTTTYTYGIEANFIKYKLNSVQKYSIKNSLKTDFGNPYSFEYTENIGITGILSFAQDYWGYYNGQHNNTGLIPDQSQIYENQGLYPIAYFPISVANTIRSKSNANRGPSSTHSIQGSLKKVVYPTNGYTVFDFEPHSFYLDEAQSDYLLQADELSYSTPYYYNYYNGSPSDESSGAGLRIATIKNYDKNGTYIGGKNFDYLSSGLLLEPINFWKVEHKAEVHANFEGYDHAYAYKVWTATSTSHSQSINIPNTVGYSYVRVEDIDSLDNAKNGNTRYHFHNYETVYDPSISKGSIEHIDARNGLPKLVEIYDESNNLLKSTEYGYKRIESSSFIAMSASHVYSSGIDYQNLFKIAYSPMISECWKEDWVKETLNGVTSITEYEYVSPPNQYLNGRLWNTTTYNGDGDTISTIYKYAGDIPGGQTTSNAIQFMLDSNYVVPIQIEKFLNGNRIGGTITNYGNDVFPFSVEVLEGTNYVTDQILSFYNRKFVGFTGRDGIPVSFLRGYNDTRIIAKVIGANYNTLTAAYSSAGQDLNELRNQTSLTFSMVTGYQYKPLSGLSWQIDPAGKITEFDYDIFGRLQIVKDHEGNPISRTDYHYSDQ